MSERLLNTKGRALLGKPLDADYRVYPSMGDRRKGNVLARFVSKTLLFWKLQGKDQLLCTYEQFSFGALHIW